MEVLEPAGLAEAVREFVASGRPTLGICLGAQVIFERSEERDTPCLGILPGERAPLSPLPCGRPGLKVPHMGWNRVFARAAHPLLAGVPDGSYFYFVHSYYPGPADPALVLAECEYGLRFAAGVGRDNLAAFQFHPEKSGAPGLRLLANFLEWAAVAMAERRVPSGLARRVIVCLDVRDGRTTKGVRFRENADVGRPGGNGPFLLRRRRGRAGLLRHHRLRRAAGDLHRDRGAGGRGAVRALRGGRGDRLRRRTCGGCCWPGRRR